MNIDVAGESVFVLRGDDGVVRGFSNVCRHRGSQLCDGASGQTKGVIMCPYHAWCYDLTGALARGADVNKPNPDGVTPLINALDNKRFDIAMFLLDKGANPSVWDMSGRTAIYVAVAGMNPVPALEAIAALFGLTALFL